VLNFVLRSRFSIWGAAAATLVCCSFRSGLCYVLASRIQPIRFEKGRILQLLVCASALYGVSLLVDLGSPWMNILCKTMVAICYPGILLVTGFLHEDETNELRVMWTRVRAWILNAA